MGRKHVAEALRSLLVSPGRSRAQWINLDESHRYVDGINRGAVARVLASDPLLVDELLGGRRTARQLKDRVGRALDGEGTGEDTLALFAEAFGWPDSVREALRQLRAADDDEAFHLLNQLRHRDTGPRPYDTIALSEHHYLGPDGLPQLHRTHQVIRAVADGVDAVLYKFDTSTIAVRVTQGGHVAGELSDLGGGLFAYRIQLPTVLRAGQTATLEYESRFEWAEPPEPEFRRGVSAQVSGVDIRVQFDPAMLPQNIEECEWPSLDEPPSVHAPRCLDTELAVHMWRENRGECLVGLRWQW